MQKSDERGKWWVWVSEHKMSVFVHASMASVWLFCVSFVNGFIVRYIKWNIPFWHSPGRQYVSLCGCGWNLIMKGRVRLWAVSFSLELHTFKHSYTRTNTHTHTHTPYVFTPFPHQNQVTQAHTSCHCQLSRQLGYCVEQQGCIEGCLWEQPEKSEDL